MSSGSFSANGTSTSQYVNDGGEGVHLSVAGAFGGGSVAVMHLVNGNPYPLLNEGAGIAFTDAADVRINVASGDVLMLVLTGATSPAIDFAIAGATEIYP